jgi:hypothetical protein
VTDLDGHKAVAILIDAQVMTPERIFQLLDRICDVAVKTEAEFDVILILDLFNCSI